MIQSELTPIFKDYDVLKSWMRRVPRKRARKNYLHIQLENTLTIHTSKMDGDTIQRSEISIPTERKALQRAQMMDEYRLLETELKELDTFLHDFEQYNKDAFQFFVLHFIEGLSQNEAVQKLCIGRHRIKELRIEGIVFYNEVVMGVVDSDELIKQMEKQGEQELSKAIAVDMKRFLKGDTNSNDRRIFCKKKGISEATFYRYIHRLKRA